VDNGDKAALASVDLDTRTPNRARMYDYRRGGKDNFAVDRLAVEHIAEILPGLPVTLRRNRAFLQSAVRYLAASTGIRQLIDDGIGLPTAENVRRVAQAATWRPR
jgi:hypothetical protein